MADSNKLIIFDTTLRDGEQSPGASMTKDEKIRIAQRGIENYQLVRVGHRGLLRLMPDKHIFSPARAILA